MKGGEKNISVFVVRSKRERGGHAGKLGKKFKVGDRGAAGVNGGTVSKRG